MQPSVFLEFVQLIIEDDLKEVGRRLCTSPELATTSLPVGSPNSKDSEVFFHEIGHYIYGGDTSLHMAAAGIFSNTETQRWGFGIQHGHRRS